jgi:isopentenyl diphosphate isomerase/L-lactate dehydrogenase-like FMN-dependent dehydrogenase
MLSITVVAGVPGHMSALGLVMALGAHAVCVGRPYLWGLAAFGQPGVERVLEIIRAETRDAMQQVGTPSIKHLKQAMVQRD